MDQEIRIINLRNRYAIFMKLIMYLGPIFTTFNLTLDDPTNENYHAMNSGAKTPSNFGAGMPWFMLSDYYNNDYVENQPVLGNYNEWWESCPEDSWCLHENRPIVFHNEPTTNTKSGPELTEVSLTRYFERPYQLSKVSKERKNTNGDFIVVEKLGFDYSAEVLNLESYYTRTDRYNTDNDITKAKFDGNRYDILLSKVKRLTPNQTSTFDTDPSTNPTTHYGYAVKSYSTDDFVCNFSVLNQVTTPLGNVQDIVYDDPDFEPVLSEMRIGGELNEGVGYSSVTLNLSRQRTFWRSAMSSFPSDLNCVSPNCDKESGGSDSRYDQVSIPSGEVAFTINMVVKQVNSEDSNGPKHTDYEYMGEYLTYESFNLSLNFVWDQGQYGAWQRGFGECKIIHAGEEGSRPYTIKRFYTSNIRFGKTDYNTNVYRKMMNWSVNKNISMTSS